VDGVSGYMPDPITVEWATPRPLFAELESEFGPFDLDAAATAENAKASRYFTLTDDGLSQQWTGRVWLNAPYGREVGQWLRKAAHSAQEGATVVALVPARPDTAWWRDATATASLVRMLPGRLRFGAGDMPAPFPSAVLVFGSLPGRHGVRAARCAACRRWWFPPRADGKTCSPRCRQALRRSRITGVSRDKRVPR